jgi:hypothetical protein
MPLAQTVDTLESVPEAARGAYVEKDGKFHLDFVVEDVTGLKRALESERGLNKAAKDKVAAWEKLGKSPEEIDEMLAAERTKAEQLAIKAGKFDEVLAKKLGDQKLEYDGKISTAEKAKASALKIAEQAVVNTSLATALTKAKASAEGLTALPKLIGDRVRIEFDENGNASSSILDADGKPMVGSLANGLANYDDLVKEAIKTFPSLFEGAGGGSGSNQNNQRRDAGGKTLTRTEFDALPPTDRMAKMKDGFKVVD